MKYCNSSCSRSYCFRGVVIAVDVVEVIVVVCRNVVIVVVVVVVVVAVFVEVALEDVFL